MKKIGHFAGLGFATIFGFSFMFSKIALETIPPMGLIAYRFLIAFLGFEFLRITKVIRIQITKKQILSILLVALSQPLLYFIFETYGLQYLSSSEAGMMIALIPIVVTILSTVILHEKPNGAQVLFILLSVSGIFLIQILKPSDGTSNALKGFLLLLGAVLSAAAYNIASRSASKKLKPFEITYFMMLSGAVVFNVIYLIQLVLNHEIASYITNLSSIPIVLYILYLGIIASIGGFFLVNFTLSKMPAHVSSIYSNLSTVVAVIAGYFFLGDNLHWYHIVGGIMIILGVYGVAQVNIIRNRKKVEII
ncbi:MAG: EamA family transporter [Bacilli bacterium]|nr:EamA family transporter [Bacilli bacterium]MBN2876610.1 EamA family transporter [Bacilli bacterium]